MSDMIRNRQGALDRRFTLLRWALVVALAVYTLLVLNAGSARNVDFDAVARAMAADPAVQSLRRGDANDFLDRFGASTEGCEGWAYWLSDDIMNVSELMVARVPDGDERDRLEAACAERLERQLGVFRGYGVEQTALLEGAILRQRGDWLFYAVGEGADRWEGALLSAIR